MNVLIHYTKNHKSDYYEIKEVVSKLAHRYQVEFALFCAKDCFPINDGNIKDQAEKCIKLIESWLYDDNKPSNKELRDAANVTYAAAHATKATYEVADHAVINATYAAFYAAKDFITVFGDKLKFYLTIAKSYLTESTFKPKIPFFNKKSDYLQDNQIEIFEEDNETNLVLNFSGYKLVANNINDMINIISKDTNAINQLRRMF